jgi:aspartyl-tRNA(Asn)/glutamyl-tRNA(Gln) amidotransferase subunit A
LEVKMTVGDPTVLSAQQLARDLDGGRLSSADVTAAFLGKIQSNNPKLNAFVDVFDKNAMEAAEAADKARRAGYSLGPLHGMPIALKDLIDVKGKVSTRGSAAWRKRKARHSATLVRHLQAQGFIILGKTHTVEFAMGGWGTNRHLGTPWNPWDLDRARTPGGSSSGSGVAVAAGLVPWAVGTDTGGSVRLPASWCGLTGLKTTFGRVSCYGILPLSQTLDTPGPMARSVEDAALLFCAMQGHDPLDPHARGLAASNPWAQMDRGVRGMRIGLMPLEERAVASDEVLAAYDRSVKLLKDLGAETAPLAMPLGYVDLGQIAGDFMAIEGYANVADLIDDDSLPLDPDVRPRLLAGRGRSAHEYLELLAKKDELAKQAAALFAGFDALVTPTTTTAALPLEKADQTKGPGHFTRFINVLGLCALALPNGASAEGLPLSLQVICKNGDEATALQIGRALQKATDWHERRPPIGWPAKP